MKTKLQLALIAIVVSFAAQAQLPDPGFELDDKTAVVITDQEVDFLSPNSVTWGIVGQSVEANNTVENLDLLFRFAQENDILVFISPHYYYPHDHKWEFEGALEKLMHNIGMFDRKDALSVEVFENSGADWMPQYKKYIEGENVIVTSPHKMYGPDSNDLVLQLRKRKIDKVILAGMSANLCVDSHLRELLEQGFEIATVSDATAAAILPDLDGYEAALTNFRMLSSHVFTTEEVIALKE